MSAIRHMSVALYLLAVILLGGVVQAQPTITSGPNYGTWSIGEIQAPLTATGGNGTFTWAVIAGSLPPGVALRTDVPSFFPAGAQAGLIGVATTPGTYSFTLQVTSNAQSVSQSATLKISALTGMDVGVPFGFVNTAYPGFTLTALNAAGPVTWAMTGGSLPTGMSFSSSGMLTGTPTTAGNFFWNVSLTDGVDTVFRGMSISVFAINVFGPSGASNPGFLPNATRFAAYSTSISATGGAGGYTFTANSLPAGLTLNSSTGTISGTVTQPGGSFIFTVTAKDTANVSFSRTVVFDVIDPPPALPSINLGNAALNLASLGQGYSRLVSATSGGTAPFMWSVSGLPPGLGIRGPQMSNRTDFSPAQVEIWGTPVALGSFPVTLTVTDSLGVTATLVFTMKVSALAIDGNDFLPNGTIGVPYSKTLRVLGGTSPYTVTQINGFNNPLPDGLSLNTSTFAVSGTPFENGSFQPVFQFGDSAGNSLQSADFFTISDATSTITVNQGYNLGTVTVGSFYDFQLSACCAAGYVWSLASGNLPPGLSISPGGDLSGTPTTPGSYLFLLKVADTTNAANTGFRQFSLIVSPMNITTGGGLPFGNVGTAYMQTLMATGGTGALTWTLNLFNVLPPGLTLSSGGVLSGTPTEPGLFFFTVTVTDSASHIFMRGFSLAIYPAGTNPPLDLVLGPNFGPFAVGGVTIQLAATGGNPPYSYSLSPGATPIAGMRTVNAPLVPPFFPVSVTGGYIGVITAPGTYNTSIRVTDSMTHTFDRAISITISPLNILISNGNLPEADPGVAYSFTFPPFGGSGNDAWSARDLPPGISMNSATGQISGTSTTPGTYFPQITLTDVTNSVSLTQGFTLVVNPFAITTPGALPMGTAGTVYSQIILAPSCGGGCTFTVVGGSLASGLSLSAGGVISGTPNFGQTVIFTIQAVGSSGTTQKVFSLQIVNNTPQPLFITNGPIVCCTAGFGASNAINLFAQGGTAPYAWSLQSGSLPTGISIQGPGDTLSSQLAPGIEYLNGRMLASGIFNFTLKVTDAANNTATKAFTWSISPVWFEYGNLPIAGNPLVYGTAYSQQLLMMGGSGNFISFTALTPMPPGLSLNSFTGVVSGTPTNTGFFSPEIQVSDDVGNVGTTFINFNIANPTGTLVNFGAGPTICCYQQGFTNIINLNLSGGTGPYTISALSALPPGFALESGSSLLSNANGSYDVEFQALSSGVFVFTLQATDSLGNIGVRTFTITVVPYTLLTTTALANGSVGVPYSQQLVTFDNSSAVTWSLAPGSAYPPGLSTSAGGLISGTPTRAGNYSFQLTATDATAVVITYTFTIRISGITITNAASVPQVMAGIPYSFTLTATGGIGPLTWSAAGLPGGIGIGPSTGTLSGTNFNGGTGTFNVTITVTDGNIAFSKNIVMYTRLQNANEIDFPISQAALADTTVGVNSVYTLVPDGGVPPFTWSVAVGSTLPPGLSLIPPSQLPPNFTPGITLLAGAPTTAGLYTFDLIATDAVASQVRRTFTLRVSPVSILFGNARTATIGTAYTEQFTAVGGTGPYTFTMAPSPFNVFQDMLPPGVTLSAGGLLSGTPTSTGNYAFNLTVTDSAAHSFTRFYNFTVNNSSGLRITNTNPGDQPWGIGNLFVINTNGASTYTTTLVGGTLPPGQFLTSGAPYGVTGTVLVGIETTPGTYIYTLRATDNANAANFADHTFTQRVSQMQLVSPDPYNQRTLDATQLGVPYSFTFGVAGGTPPYTFSEVSQAPLPPGLTLSAAGVLSGTPTQIGVFFLEFSITDSMGDHVITGVGPFTITPAATAPPLVTNLGGGGGGGGGAGVSLGLPISSSIFSLDRYIVTGTGPFTWSVAGGSALPPGMALLPGVSTYAGGTPTAAGTYNFSIVVMDASGQSVTAPAALTVSPLGLTPEELPNGIVGNAYSLPLTASGGTAPYTFQVDPTQALPAGLSLSAAGVLLGTPMSAGFFPVTVILTDNNGMTLKKNLPMTVDNSAGQSPAISLRPQPVRVSYVQNGANPAPIPISVSRTSGNLSFNISVSGVPGASLSANSGTAPASVNLNLNTSGVAPGAYTGIVAAKSGPSVNLGDATAVVLTVFGPVPVSITSSPSGASITVTGTGCAPGPYTTPANLVWSPLTQCSVRFADPLSGMKFASTTIGGSATSSANPLVVNSGASTLSINATYASVTGTTAGNTTHFSVTPSSLTATAGVPVQFTVTALTAGNATDTTYTDPVHLSSSDLFASLGGDVTLTSGVGVFTASLVNTGSQTLTASDLFTPAITGTSASITVSAPSGLRYVTVTPCRVVDTRNPVGTFGGPLISAGTSRDFPIPSGACGIPATAQAYSFNVAVVPPGPLGFLTVWPTGLTRPVAATLNSLDGRIKSNAAIVPAGTSGSVSVYATNDTNVILDINGYFVPAATAGALAFYPVTPCRLVDTRNGTLVLGSIIGGTSRTLPLLSSSCNLPATAQAYSLNLVAVPPGPVGFVTAYPTGTTRPVVASLNDLTGTIVANGAIVPAGTGGSIDVFASNTTQLVVDINGYFAPAGTGGLSLYNLPPCRALDTRKPAGSPAFSGQIDVNVIGSGCGGTPSVQAYVFNSTVVPSGPLGFLTLWPQGTTRPTVATLNALDGAITNNMAIVPTIDTEVSAYATNPTQLILDISGYFAP